MAMGGDIISDWQIGEAQINAKRWMVHAQDLEAANAQLQNEVARLKAENAELGDAAAGNLAWRYQLMEQLRAIDPWNPLVVNEPLIGKLVENAQRLYAIRKNFDDVRNFAKKYIRNYADKKTTEIMTREEFIHHAKIGAMWGAFKDLLDEPFDGRPASHKARYFLERLPDMLIQIAGDTNHPAFRAEKINFIEGYAGREWDRLKSSGKLEDDPKCLPVKYAIEFGLGAAEESEKNLGELQDLIEGATHRPPAMLVPPYPAQAHLPPFLIP